MATTYLQITPERIAPDVILVGDPARAHLAAERLESITAQGKNREFTYITGRVQATGRPVTIAACGIGAPAWAIAMTELHGCGARRFVRLGTALTPVLPLGTIALARSALRYDRVSEDYLPIHVPVLPDRGLLQALAGAFAPDQGPVTEALFASFSTFYGEMEPLPPGTSPAVADPAITGPAPIRPDITGPATTGPAPTTGPATGSLDQSEFRRALALGAQAVDMETALVLAYGQRFGVAAAAACLCTVTGNGGPNMARPDQRARELTLIDGVYRAFAQAL